MKAERGFSLVEIVVAITLLGGFLLGIAKANFVIARRFYALSGGGPRAGEIAQQVNEFAALPFDSLKGKVGTKTFGTMPVPFTRTIVVDSLSPTVKRVTIILTPVRAGTLIPTPTNASVNTTFRPDTEAIQRSKPAQNPFNH